MAYQSGSSTGTTDLLDKLNTFAIANGWILNRRDATSLSISKGSVFQNLFEDGSSIRLSASTGYSAGSVWNAQPGASGNEQNCNLLVGSLTKYHFFLDQNYIHTVIEINPGLFQHFLFGELEKSSAYTGGHYSLAEYEHAKSGADSTELFGSTSQSDSLTSGSLSVSLDSLPSIWHSLMFKTNVKNRRVKISCPFNGQYRYDSYLNSDRMTYGYNYMVLELYLAQPNTFNSLALPIPLKFYIERNDYMYSPIGSMYDIGCINMTHFTPSEEITIGSDTWIVFPVRQKNLSDTDVYSGFRGIMYKKIV